VDAAQVFNCKLSHIHFLYLDFPIGGDARHFAFWTVLVEKISCKLSLWKSRHLSMGGRLVLIKYALSSISVYFLSFFKAPAGIVYLIESIFKAIFCGARVRNLGKLIR
jgi:hypothetical protein